MKRRTWCWLALLFSALAVWALHSGSSYRDGFSHWLATLSQWLQNRHWLTATAAAALLSALGLPRQIIAFGFGQMLPPPLAIALASLAATLACTLDFVFGRYCLRPWLAKRHQSKLVLLDKLLQESAFLKALALRLFPSGSNLLTSLLAGASSVRPLPFISGSALGYLPQMILFAYLGAGAAWALTHQHQLSLWLLVVTALLFALLLWRHWRSKATAPQE